MMNKNKKVFAITHSTFRKLLSLLLTCSLLAVSLPLAAFTAKEDLPSDYEEIISARDEYTKTYKNADGSYSSVMYAEQIHVRESDSSYSDIDNSLVYDLIENRYSNRKNKSFGISFSPYANDDYFVSFSDQNGRKLSWTIFADGKMAASDRIEIENGEKITDDSGYPFPAKITSHATYGNIFGNETDLAYTVSQNKIEEDIVIRKQTDLRTFTFRYFAGGLDAELLDDGSVAFTDESGKQAFFVSAPFVYDADHVVSDGTSVALRKENGLICIDYTMDKDWLNDEKRAYPVVFDPSVTNQDYTNTLTDTYTKTNSTSNYSSAGGLYVGKYNGTTYHTFLRYSQYPDMTAFVGSQAYEIISATLKMSFVSNTTTMEETGIYPVNSSWAASSIRYNNEPSYGALLDSGKYGDPNVIYSSGEYKSITFDITENIAQCMYKSTTDNGFMLRYVNETQTNDYNIFASITHSSAVRHPVLTVNYSLVGDSLRTSDSYKIKNVGSGKYLEVRDGINKNGTNVYQTSADDDIAQRFILRDGSSEGAIRFQAECSTLVGKPRYLDIASASSDTPQSGTNVQIYLGNYPATQDWIAQKNSDGSYLIRLHHAPNLVLTACGNADWTSGTSSSSAGNVFISTYNASNANQKWLLENCGAFDKSDSILEPIYDEMISEDDIDFSCGDFNGNISLYSGKMSGAYYPGTTVDSDYPIPLAFYFDSNCINENYYDYIGLNHDKTGNAYPYAHGCVKLSYYEFLIPEYSEGQIIAYRYISNEGTTDIFRPDADNTYRSETYEELTVTNTGLCFTSDGITRIFDSSGFITGMICDDITYSYSYVNGRLNTIMANNTVCVSLTQNSIVLYDDTENVTVTVSLSDNTFVYGTFSCIRNAFENTLTITDKDERIDLLFDNRKVTEIHKSRRVNDIFTAVPSEEIRITYTDNTSEVRMAGVDGTIHTADDLITDYTFDFLSRKTTVISYADADKSAIANTVIFDNNVSGSTADSGRSITVDNGSNKNLWLSGVPSGQNYSTTAAKKYNGSSITFSQNGYYQKTISIQAGGKYTFSAYIRLEGLEFTGSDGGLRLMSNLNGYQSSFCSEYYSGTTSADIDNGWQRISYTFDVPGAGPYYVKLCADNISSGTAYVCSVQLEKGSYPTPYNLTENLGQYSASGKYTGEKQTALASIMLNGLDADGLLISAKQNIDMKSPYRCAYGGDPDSASFSKMRVVLVYSDSSSGPFHSETYDLTFSLTGESVDAVYVRLNKECLLHSVSFYALTNRFVGTATFSDISLREALFYSDEADDGSNNEDDVTNRVDDPVETTLPDGNKQTVTVSYWENNTYTEKTVTDTTVTDADDHIIRSDIHTVEYSSANVISKEYGTITECVYGTDHKLLSETVQQVIYTGGVISSRIVTETVHSTVDGNEAVTVTDENGNDTTTVYDSNGNVRSITYPNGLAPVSYTYNNDKLTQVTQNGISNSMTYVGETISTVTHSDGNSLTETYSFAYDTNGDLLSVSVGNRTLVSYTYTGGGYLSGITYANGYTESYEYDIFGNLISYAANDTVVARYTYDGCGRLLEEQDILSDTKRRYEYDADGNLLRKTDVKDGAVALVTEYAESGTRYKIAGDSIPAKEETEKTTDSFGRITGESRDIGSAAIEKEYTYKNTGGNTTHTIESETFSDGDADIRYSYIYDANNRLTEIKNGDIINGTTVQRFVYDPLGQLIREDNLAAGKTYTWVYDGNGNILSKREYLFTTADTLGQPLNTVNYGYTDSNWKDLLTSYNGVTITSDASGNPLNWRNASSMTWNGRQLTGMTLSDNTAASYTYNADGIRTSKTVGARKTDYLLDGTKVLKQITTDLINGNTEQILFCYDTTEELVGFKYDDQDYWYGKDINGVIRYIYNNDGEICAEYVYDAWGRIISAANLNGGTVAEINPFRYKSYYYDTETGFYYLQSRYYDPTIARFISADSVDFLGASGSVLSYNLFCYCENDSVQSSDPSGCLIWPGEIHSYVQNVLAAYITLFLNCFTYTNYFIRFSKFKYGFADLYAKKWNEIWEVKRNNANYIESGKNQLKKYINGISGAKSGRNLGVISFYYVTRLLLCYKITVESISNDGMIYYDYDLCTKTTALVALSVVSIALIVSGVGSGVGVASLSSIFAGGLLYA